MKLITEIYEDVNYIIEDKSKNMYIEGVFLQSDIKNRNGRLYPTAVLQKEVKRYSAEYIDKGRAFGELGHPNGPSINLERVSHLIKELYQDGNNFIGKAKIMTETPYGSIVKNLIHEGAKLGVSSRGMGSIKEKKGLNTVQDDFHLATAADIVADPSAPDAFVNGIMEGKEWVWSNGIISEYNIDNYHKLIKKESMSNIEKTKIKIFEDFLNKL
jgi:hypothetical protein